MPTSEAPPSPRSFLLALSATLGLGLAAIGAFNWWENPLSAFDRGGDAGNNAVPTAELLNADRGDQMRWLIHQVNRSDPKTVLVGPSTVLYGISTCDYPDLRRYSLFDLNNVEMAQLLDRMRLHGAASLFLIGISGRGQENRRRASRDWTWWRDFLDPKITRLSFARWRRDHLDPKRPACSALAWPKIASPETFSRHKIDQATARFASEADETGLSETLAAAAGTCVARPRRIVLFTLPLFVDKRSAERTVSILDRNAKSIRPVVARFAARFPNCDFRFEDLASSYALDHRENGANAADWYDVYHFRPGLGRHFLRELMKNAP